MRYHETCHSCGHQETAFMHAINKPLISALRELVDWYETTKSPANLQKNLHLTKNQYNNFQKLQYFGVVVRTEKGWYPTITGIEFIYGREKISDRVATINGNVLAQDHPAWKTTKKYPVLVGVQDVDVTSYKRRSEYQEEKSSQIQISYANTCPT